MNHLMALIVAYRFGLVDIKLANRTGVTVKILREKRPLNVLSSGSLETVTLSLMYLNIAMFQYPSETLALRSKNTWLNTDGCDF